METRKKDLPAMPEAPYINAQGIKVYPTSWVPQKAPLEPSRVPTAQMTNFHIEVIHIIVFLLILIALYWSMWVNAKSSDT